MKKGFTLIELLAVIVILAIIALIATPIILGIINDARKESNERSVELYASAIRNGIAAYQLREMKEVAVGSYTSETLPFDVEYDSEVECSTIELYDNGDIYVAGCTINDTDVDYTYGTKQIIKGKLNSVCTPAETQYFADSPLEAGYKYNCKVDPSKDAYTFYVLNSTETTVNLIMSANVTSGVTEWYVDENNNSDGPITAMDFLQTKTSNWINLNQITVSTFERCDEQGSCTIQEMKKTYNTYSRLPYSSEISDYDGTNAYLYDNLALYCYNEDGEVDCDLATDFDGINIEGLEHDYYEQSYLTLSSDESDTSGSVWEVRYSGIVGGRPVADPTSVRPVINLSI